MNIKKWYLSKYDDELGNLLDEKAEFNGDFWNNIPNIYDYIGVYDSLIRERVFERFAEIRNISYDTVYLKWLRND